MKQKQKGFTLSELMLVLFWVVVVMGGAIGWVLNIIKLCSMAMDPVTGFLIVRIAGIFVFPIGMVAGWL